MEVKIRIHPGSSQEKIEELEKDKSYEVWLKEKPIDEKANKELIKRLKKYFRKDIKMVSGFSSRIKILEVE
jgi:uncharacterized protein (TIGR00251 family)